MRGTTTGVPGIRVPDGLWDRAQLAWWAVVGILIAAGATLVVALVEELAAPPTAGVHHDVLAFYAAGWLVLHGNPGAMYDPATITAIQRTIIPHPVGMNGYMPFINPPFAAVLFAPLAALPEPAARATWAVLNAGLAAACAAWIGRGLSGLTRLAVFYLVLLSFPLYHALAEGQWSILLLAAGLASLALARTGRWGLAGLALSILFLKPQFIVLPLLALVVARRWRAIAAALAGGIAKVLASIPFTGIAVYGQFATYLLSVVLSHFSGAGAVHAAVWQGDLASTEGLNGFLVGFLGQGRVAEVNVLWAVLVAGVLALYGLAIVRSGAGFDTFDGRLRLAAGIGVVLLVNPNQFVQDCTLIFLAVEALRPFPPRAAPWIIAGVAALGAIVWIDQVLEPYHLFVVVALAVVAAVSIDGIRRGAWPRPLVRLARLAPAPWE